MFDMPFDELVKKGLVVAVLLWVGGCIVNETLRAWSPVVRKCSVAVTSEYERMKESVLESRIESMQAEERTRQAREAEKKNEKELRQQQEAAAAEVKHREAVQAAQEARRKQVMSFVEHESPRLCEVYGQLKVEIETQSGKIKDLKKTLDEFGFDSEKDSDVQALNKQLELLQKSVLEIERLMIDAYIAAKKFEAAPVRKEFDTICRKAFEDGVAEAESAIARYNELKKTK